MNSLATIKRILTLKCEESTRLVSESLDRDLSPGERWAVRLHALCCWSCRRFRKQIEVIRQAMERYGADGEPSPAPGGARLSDAARAKMSQAIARQSTPNDKNA